MTLDLRKKEDIEAAYHVAYPEGSDVMVERFIPGDEHRILVVRRQGGSRRARRGGQHHRQRPPTVKELIDSQLNSDPAAATRKSTPWKSSTWPPTPGAARTQAPGPGMR